MSQHLTIKVAALENRVKVLEYQLAGLLKKFPPGLHAKHKGFNNWYICDRFDNPVHDAELTKSACEALYERIKPDMDHWTGLLEGICVENNTLYAWLDEKEAA